VIYGRQGIGSEWYVPIAGLAKNNRCSRLVYDLTQEPAAETYSIERKPAPLNSNMRKELCANRGTAFVEWVVHGLRGKYHYIARPDKFAGALGDDVCTNMRVQTIVDHGHSDTAAQRIGP
jgi:hypothetical protein